VFDRIKGVWTWNEEFPEAAARPEGYTGRSKDSDIKGIAQVET
jgi:hypothetical protein